MNLLRHSINIVLKTAARPAAVLSAFGMFVVVAGTEPAHAAIENTATAGGIYNGNPVSSAPDTVSVPVAAPASALEVTKLAVPDADVTAGTLVTYTYTIRNAGTLVLSNVSLSDLHDGSGPAPVPANEALTTDAGVLNDSSDASANDGIWSTLAPGDVITLTATYTITQNDVDTKQ
jgi:large repetitive protein